MKCDNRCGVIRDRGRRSCLPVHVRFASKEERWLGGRRFSSRHCRNRATIIARRLDRRVEPAALCTAPAAAPFVQSAPAEGAMGSGRKPATRSSARKKKLLPPLPTGVPPWPRLDMLPPEQMLSGLRDWGRLALTSGYLDGVDYAVVQDVVKRLRTAEPELLALLGRLNDTALARRLLELIAGVAGGAYVVGAHGAMSETARMFFAKSQARRAQIRRQQALSEREPQLLAAIEEALRKTGGPSKHPHKDAAAIQAEVSARLGKPVSADTIVRRLRRQS